MVQEVNIYIYIEHIQHEAMCFCFFLFHLQHAQRLRCLKQASMYVCIYYYLMVNLTFFSMNHATFKRL